MSKLKWNNFSCPNLTQVEEKAEENPPDLAGDNPRPICSKHPPAPLTANKAKFASIFRHYYPEGGWGYVVLIIGMLAHILSHGYQLSFGIGGTIAVIRKFGAGRLSFADVGWLGAFSASFSLIISPITMSLCIQKSTRLTAVFGGLVTALGVLFTSFAVQFHQLFISYGLIIGLGVGMTRDPCTLMVGQYFKRKREVVEIFLVSSSGIGLAVMSVLIQIALRYLGWILGLQAVTVGICLTFLLGAFHRSASLYHPQRRAILHLKSQKRKIKSKDKTMIEESLPFLDFKTLKSKTVQILLMSIATQQALKAEIRGYRLLLLNVYLGMGWFAGCCLFGGIVVCGDRRIPRQYLCQTSLFISGISILSFTGVSEYQEFVVFSWIYGLFLGGYNYSLKMYIYEKVRARNFGRAWGYTQCAMAVSNVLGVFISGQMNSRYGNKSGFLFSSLSVVIGSLVMILIDVHRRQLRQKQGSAPGNNRATPHPSAVHQKGSPSHHSSAAKEDQESERVSDVENEEEEDKISEEIQEYLRKPPLKHVVSLFSREDNEEDDDLDFNYFYENFCVSGEEGGRRRLFLLDENADIADNITSCNKVENCLVFSEYEQNLIKETEGLMINDGNGARRMGRRKSSIFKSPSDLGRRLSKSQWWNESKRNITVIDEASV